MLVNGRTHSGMEAFASGFRKYQLRPAVDDVLVDDERLASVTVAPTIEVRPGSASLGGVDPKVDRAVAVRSIA
jgi:hypothetical protein